MRLVSWEVGGGIAYGRLIGDRIARLDQLPGASPDLKSFLGRAHATGWPDLDVQADIPIAEVRLLPPIPNPDKVLCVATNFRESGREGQAEPEYPLVFTRFGNSFTGHARSLVKPDVSEKYDFEGELAVVIGKAGHKISADEAMHHVGGYCCLNDGSVRDWQKHSSQFTPGKNFYRSGSFGPWLVTADEIPDPKVLALRTSVNGVVKQQIGMDRMIFDIPWLISYFSTFTELVVGDVIATGTPSGFGSTRTPPEFLSIGDEIEVEIAGVGTLHNIVAGERSSG